MAARRRDGIRIRAKPSQLVVVPTSNAADSGEDA